MVLDLLPFKQPSGRLSRKWGWLRYLHFALSLGVVLVAYFVFGVKDGASGQTALIWYLAGNLLYYLVLFYPVYSIVTLDRNVEPTRYKLMKTLLLIFIGIHILMGFVIAMLVRA